MKLLTVKNIIMIAVALMLIPTFCSIRNNVATAIVLNSAADNNATTITCERLESYDILITFRSPDRNLDTTISHTISRHAYSAFEKLISKRNWQCDGNPYDGEKITWKPKTKYDAINNSLRHLLKSISSGKVETIFYLPDTEMINDLGIVRLLGYHEITNNFGTKLSQENWDRFVKIAEEDGWQFGEKHKYHGIEDSPNVIRGTHPKYQTP